MRKELGARGTAISDSETLIITVASPPEYIPLVIKVFRVEEFAHLDACSSLEEQRKEREPKKWGFVF